MPIKKPFTQRMLEAAGKGLTAFSSTYWDDPGEAPVVIDEGHVVRRKFMPGINANYLTKESEVFEGTLKEGVSFEDLRALADTYEILRSVIDTCKDQIYTQKLVFRLKLDMSEKAKEYKDKTKKSAALKQLEAFFKSPDGTHTLIGWLRLIMEEFLVTDAVAILKRVNFKGEIIGLDVIDGTTIQPLLDKNGRRPLPPFPAYVQVIDGLAVAQFTVDELLYLPRNVRVHKLYGQSPVEMVTVYSNIGLRRVAFQIGHYTEGNIPAGFQSVPEDWTPEQIEEFQKLWDDIFSGNAVAKSKMRFLPGGIRDPVFPKMEVLKDEFDEWLARVICHVFSVSPNSFIRNLNRATGEQQREQADEEGMFSRMAYLKDLLDYIVEFWFGFPECESSWVPARPQDSQKQQEMDVEYVKHGIKSIDEVRVSLGLHPLGIPPGIMLSSGMLFFHADKQDIENLLTTTTQIILTDRDKSNDPKAPTDKEKDSLTESNATVKEKVADE